MPDQSRSAFRLWVVSSLAVLAIAAATPWTVPSGLSSAPRGPSRLLANLSPGHPSAHASEGRIDDDLERMKGLPSEDEEQENDCADAETGIRVSIRVPGSFRLVLDRRSLAGLAILSHYHLRC